MILVYTPTFIIGKTWKNLEEVHSIIKTGGDLNMYNEEGYTGLMVAAAQGNVPLAKALIVAGADINLQSRSVSGNTALHEAVYNSDSDRVVEIVKMLVDNGADIRARNKDQDTPLHFVVHIEDLAKRQKVALLLVKKGADINAQGNKKSTMLHVAIEMNAKDWIEMAIDLFGSIINFSLKNDFGFTLKEYAQDLGFTDIVDVLSKPVTVVGIDGNIGAHDKIGYTGLMLAVIREDQGTVQKLLNLGADINERSQEEYRNTALHIALLHQNLKMIQLLAEKGAQITIQNATGNTAIHYIMRLPFAVQRKRVAELILKNTKGDLNIQNNNGDTFLHLVARANDVELMQFLIDLYGYRLNGFIKNNDNKTPLDIAQDRKYNHIIPLLEEIQEIGVIVGGT